MKRILAYTNDRRVYERRTEGRNFTHRVTIVSFASKFKNECPLITITLFAKLTRKINPRILILFLRSQAREHI